MLDHTIQEAKMRSFTKIISPGLVVAGVVAGLAWSGTAAGGGPAAAPMVIVKETHGLAQDSQVIVRAFCPPGYQVISGGFSQGAKDGIVIVAGPIQHPEPGYEVQVLNPPGVGATSTDVTAEAYCARVGHPLRISRNLAEVG